MRMRPPVRPDLLEEIQDLEEALRSGDPAAHSYFAAWIRRSPEHLHAYLQHYALEKEFEGVDAHKEHSLAALLAESSSNVVPLVTSGSQLPRSDSPARKAVLPRRYILGLIAAATACLTFGFLFWHSPGRAERWTDYVTAVGEQRRMALPDGSIIELNTRTHIRLSYADGHRDVQLVSGEALFNVHHDEKRPFSVWVRSNLIQDVGTQFAVRLRPDNSATISVLEGRVQVVAGPSQPQLAQEGASPRDTIAAQISAGETAQMDSYGVLTRRSRLNLAEAASWRQHRIWFENSTLQEIAAEVNRYNVRQIQVAEDPAVVDKRYTVTWDPYDLDSLISYLKNDPELTLQINQDSITIRGK